MNKIYKYILGIGIIILGIGSCNAERMQKNIKGNIFNNTSDRLFELGDGGCFWKHTTNNSTMTWNFVNGNNGTTNDATIIVCGTGEVNLRISGTNSYYAVATGMDLTKTLTQIECNAQYAGYILPSSCPGQYTSLQCQTEYNLIPIDSVTANYCHVNFGLIDPMDCPVSEGTGSIQWSALYINNLQYASTNNINISIPEDIAWSVDYNDTDTDIEIEGYNADTTYIEKVINNEKLTPTAEDFSYLMVGLAEFIPYLFIGLLIFFMVRIFNKIWK